MAARHEDIGRTYEWSYVRDSGSIGPVSVTSVRNSQTYVTEAPNDRVRLDVEFLRFEDAAAILRLSEREIYRLVEDGDLVVHSYKRRKLVDPDSVHRLAERIRNGDFAREAAA